MKTPIKSALLLAACATCAPFAAPIASAQTATGPAQVKAATNVSDQEVDEFATAVIAFNGITKDTSLDKAAKQKKMIATLKASGLEPDRFNSIAKAAQTQDALKARVSAAVAKKTKPAG